MNHYDVYVLGNALVDLEYRISDDRLTQLGIDKSVMTLVDAEQQQQLLKALDSANHVKACGGSAPNTAYALAEFGCRVFLSIKVANDPLGHFYLNDMQRIGITTNLSLEKLEKGHTGTCLATITPDGERSMCTYLGISSELSVQELDLTALQHAQYLYLESYSAPSPLTLEAAIKAHELAQQFEIKTALSLSDPNMVQYCNQEVMTIVNRGVDLLFCNLHEAQLLCESTDLAVIKTTLATHAKQFVITLGENGCLTFDGDTYHEIPAENIDVVDTLGAGDMFAGAFLTALIQGKDFYHAGLFANRAAGRIVAKFGPRLTHEEARLI